MSLPAEAKDWSKDRLEVEILDRKHLLSKMVGTLYPRLLSDEIAELVALQEVTAIEKWLRE